MHDATRLNKNPILDLEIVARLKTDWDFLKTHPKPSKISKTKNISIKSCDNAIGHLRDVGFTREQIHAIILAISEITFYN